MCDSLFDRNNCKTQKKKCAMSYHSCQLTHCSWKYQFFEVKKEIIIDLMSHCPYSPDLTHDFLLFPSIKNKICDHWFRSLEEAIEAYTSYVSVMQI